jgi:protein-L-isoaspartate O-methyltransferase
MIDENSYIGNGRVGRLQRTLNEAFDGDFAFMIQGGDKTRTSYMPFQIADFVAIMTEVVAITDGVKFLEVGCGIGTKSMIARELFGLITSGIEYSGYLADEALKKARGPVWVGDALDYPYGYDKHDIIWLYRPFRDEALEDQLEQKIYTEMKSGAILAGAALQNPPQHWTTVVDDFDMGNRGAWKKP